MVVQDAEKVYYRKALIAGTAAFCCLVIYILACVYSPVAWSPDSAKIALLVTPPEDKPQECAIFIYDIATGEHTLLDKIDKGGVLSGPAWSPDGKWIAYYKVDPPPPEESTSGAQTGNDPKGPGQAQKQAEAGTADSELFSEANRILPPFLLDIVGEIITSEEADREFFSVKLMLVRPDGKEKKVLRVMQWVGGENERMQLMHIKPEWSPDSARIFYARSLSDDTYYIGSLNIATGETWAHFFSSLGNAAVSPDGKWVASLYEDTLVAARIDGSMHKYFKVETPDDTKMPNLITVAWSPDGKHILGRGEDKFWVLDTATGERQQYQDPKAKEKIAYGLFAPTGEKLYYLAEYESDAADSAEKGLAISSIRFDNKQVEVVTFLPELSDVEMVGQLSVAPNGKVFLLRYIREEKKEEEKSILLFWDGIKKKIVETDSWLIGLSSGKGQPGGEMIK